MKIMPLLCILAALVAPLASCSSIARVTNPGPAQIAPSEVGPPQLTEYDIIRLRIMNDMAGGPKRQ